MFKKKIIVCLFLAWTVLTLSVAPAGAYVTWTGANSSDWGDKGNWSADPTNDFARILNSTNSPITAVTDTVTELEVVGGATVNIGTSATLTVSGAGNSIGLGAFEWPDGGDGTLNLSGSGSLSSSSANLLLGDMTYGGDAYINLSGTSSLTVNWIYFGMRQDSTVTVADSATLTTGGMQFGWSGDIGYYPDNQLTITGGTVDCSGGSITVYQYVNSVNIDMSGGLLKTQSITWSAPSGDFEFSGGEIILDGNQVGFNGLAPEN